MLLRGCLYSVSLLLPFSVWQEPLSKPRLPHAAAMGVVGKDPLRVNKGKHPSFLENSFLDVRAGIDVPQQNVDLDLGYRF